MRRAKFKQVTRKSHKKRERKEQTIFKSYPAAASFMGYSPGFLKQLRDVGSPGFSANGTIDTKLIRAWMLENPTKIPTPSHWKDSLGMEKLRGEKRKNDMADGLLVKKSDVAERLQRIFRPMVSRIEQMLTNEYPAKVVGLDVPSARIYGKRVLDMILDAHREAATEWQT